MGAFSVQSHVSLCVQPSVEWVAVSVVRLTSVTQVEISVFLSSKGCLLPPFLSCFISSMLPIKKSWKQEKGNALVLSYNLYYVQTVLLLPFQSIWGVFCVAVLVWVRVMLLEHLSWFVSICIFVCIVGWYWSAWGEFLWKPNCKMQFSSAPKLFQMCVSFVAPDYSKKWAGLFLKKQVL